jgi:hypothetical protein
MRACHAPTGRAGSSALALAWLLASGLAGVFALICIAEAVARAPVSAFATCESVMIWALMFDLVIVGGAALLAPGVRLMSVPRPAGGAA